MPDCSHKFAKCKVQCWNLHYLFQSPQLLMYNIVILSNFSFLSQRLSVCSIHIKLCGETISHSICKLLQIAGMNESINSNICPAFYSILFYLAVISVYFSYFIFLLAFVNMNILYRLHYKVIFIHLEYQKKNRSQDFLHRCHFLLSSYSQDFQRFTYRFTNFILKVLSSL